MSNNKIGAVALFGLMLSLPLQVAANTADSSGNAVGESTAADATDAVKAKSLDLSLPSESSTPVTEKKPAAPSSVKKTTSTDTKLKISLREEPAKRPKPKRKIYTPPTLKAVVNVNEQRMRVYVGGQLQHTWKVSTGRRGYYTPNGTFKPQWLSRMHYSRQYDNSPMPYSVFFHEGFATHGTNYVSRLGRPASHGCVRLHTNNARAFFNLVRKHGKSKSRIVIVGSTPSYGATRLASRANYGTRYRNGRVQESFSIFGYRGRDRDSRSPRRVNRSAPSFLNH